MIFQIYKKEMKDAIRDSKTLLLSVLLPMVLIIGMVFFYDNMLFDNGEKNTYRIGVSDTLEPAMLEWLQQAPDLEIVTDKDPIAAAENGDVNAAVLLQGEFDAALTSGSSVLLNVHADPTSKRSSEAVAAFKQWVSLKQDEIVEQRLSEVGIAMDQLQPIQLLQHSFNPGSDASLMLLSMMLSLVIMLSVMLGGFPIATDMFAGEKERQTMEALLITPVSRVKLITAKWLAISTISAAGGIFSIVAFLLFTSYATKNMSNALNFGDQPLLLAVSALLGIVMFALLFATLEMMVSIYAKSFKEAQNYLTPVMFLAMIPYFALIGVGPAELKTVDFLIPFMNIYALLKELIYGIFNWQSILMVSGSSLVFITIAFLAASWMFKKDKWVLK